LANYSQRFTYYSIILFPNFQAIIILSNQPIIVPLFSKSTMQPQQKLIAMTCAFKFNPKATVFLCINLRSMSMDKWGTSKSTKLSTKVWVKLLVT